MKFCFVFICQKGELEIKSMLLAASLIENLKCNYEIVAAIPYPETIWGTISYSTERLIKKLGIRKVNIKNQIDLNYPIGNKLSCLGIQTDADKIIFLDSDILCIKEFNPEEYLLDQFNAKPADGSTFGDWNPVYELFNIELPKERVIATSTKQEMLPYFNAGMIAIDNNNEFAKVWVECCKRIDESDNINNKRPWLDQIGLPITVKKLNWSYGILDERFNFPAHKKEMPKDLPFLCHYHFPETILNESRLLKVVTKLVKKHPFLKDIASNITNWEFISSNMIYSWYMIMLTGVKRRIKNTYSSVNNQVKNKLRSTKPELIEERNIIITGIPRSGTSYLCKLLFALENIVVINEPTDIFSILANSLSLEPLKEYFKELRNKIIVGEKISNKIQNGEIIEDTAKHDERILFQHHFSNSQFLLAVKNTLAFISVLPFIKQSMPKSHVIVCIRNPIDTIASWKNSFPHLSNVLFENFPKVFFNESYQNGWQRDAIMEIKTSSDIEIKRALLWNYLAEIIDRNRESVVLIKYEDFVYNPNKEVKKILRPFPEFTFNFPASKLRTRKDTLSNVNIDKIQKICGKQALKFGYKL